MSTWIFNVREPPRTLFSAIDQSQVARVDASLKASPQLVSQLVFSPRPVLVEGPSDVKAMSTALNRLHDPAVVAQTELTSCGSSNDVALWYSICTLLAIDVRAVADLDAMLNRDVQKIVESNPKLAKKYREHLFVDSTVEISKRFIEAANAAGIAKNPKDRARWLASLPAKHVALQSLKAAFIEVWKSEGLWLHPQGTIEDVLGVEKGKTNYVTEAQSPGPIDDVVSWCAYALDTTADLLALLQNAVEKIAANILVEVGLNPSRLITGPIGSTAERDARLVRVIHRGAGKYKLEVLAPVQFAGYWTNFDRDTPLSQIRLVSPDLSK